MQQHNATNVTLWSPPDNLAPSILLSLCALLGVPGNLVVVVAILHNIQHATPTVRLMLNLAWTDLFSLLLVLLWVPGLLGDWPYNAAFCKLLSYVLYTCMYSSLLTVTLMSVQRYLLVACPFGKLGPRAWVKNQKMILGCLWLMALLLGLPALVWRELMNKDGRLRCQPKYSSDMEQAGLLLLETALGFVVPGILLSTSYFCISRRVSQLPFTSSQRLSRLVTWVVAAFLILWFPTHVANTLHICAVLMPSTRVTLHNAGESLRNVAGALTFFNSCLNPFLYAFASRKLRGSNSLMKRMERVWHSKQTDTPPTSSRKTSLCIQSCRLAAPNQTSV